MKRFALVVLLVGGCGGGSKTPDAMPLPTIDAHPPDAAPRTTAVFQPAAPGSGQAWGALPGADGTPVLRATGFDPATGPSLTALAPALPAATLSHVVTATVFRTEHVTRGLVAMRAVVTATPPIVTIIDQTFSTVAELDD